VRDIAQALKISIGTVDRALHNRPGINAITRKQVLDTAQKLGYRPNVSARLLAGRRRLRLAVCLPVQIASYFDAVRAGIASAAAPYSSSVELLFRSNPNLGQGEVELLQQTLEEDPLDGLIFCPGDPDGVRQLMRRAAARRIPVVCVNTDAPNTRRLTSVAMDGRTGGMLAGELMHRFLPTGGEVAIVTGLRTTLVHLQETQGFRDALESLSSSLRVVMEVEAHDEPNEAYEKCSGLLAQHPDLRGIYVCTANSMAVLRALADFGRTGEVTIIGTDIFPELAEAIRAGKVMATIYQRPARQGRLAFESLFRFLVEGVCPPQSILVTPSVILRANLDSILKGVVRQRSVPSVPSEMAAMEVVAV
jgi:LacI family transcriptional regulator